MRTIVLDEPYKFRAMDTAEPDPPKPGEALVQIRRLGICGTDYHAYRGRQPFFTYPRILGHELGVEILALGSDESDLKVGDLCAVEPYLNCGQCIACRAGKTNCCASLKVLGVHIDGGMRERIVVPTHKLHKSAKLTLDQLALVETLGIGAHAVERADIRSGENVLVIGAGPIGLTVMQFANAAGARVIAMDVNSDRLAFCTRYLQIADTLSPNEESAEHLSALTNGDLPTAVFDATGNQESMQGAFKFASSTGRIIFVGLFLGDITLYDPDFHRKELTLLATRNSTGKDFKKIIGLLEAGVVDTTPWITHRSGFSDLTERFSGWLDPAQKVIKSVVTYD